MLDRLRRDYVAMAAMIFGRPPSFEGDGGDSGASETRLNDL
jgi:hypothetical protein